MVYESDFYTTRRPYRSTPAYSSYTTSYVPSRQVRILPGLGKVHIVHSYDRIVPYVGHKRLTVVTTPPKVFSTRPSVLQRELDWIEHKARPWVSYSATNRYLNSDSAVRITYVRYPPITASYSYDWDYCIPSRYYSTYRIVRPLNSGLFRWPLSASSDYWPVYRTLSYLDDIPVYRSLRLQRLSHPLTWLNCYPAYRWCDYYDYKYYRPLASLYYPTSLPYCVDRYWPSRYLAPYAPYCGPEYYKRSHYWFKYRPVGCNGLSSYCRLLDSIFDDETRRIRSQTVSLLKRIHDPVPRHRDWPLGYYSRYDDFASLPVRYDNTNIYRMMTVSPRNKVEYTTYYTEPVRKYIGDRAYGRRPHLTHYEDPVKNDIQLLSYYIAKFRQEKAQPKAEQPARAGSVEEKSDKVEITELPAE